MELNRFNVLLQDLSALGNSLSSLGSHHFIFMVEMIGSIATSLLVTLPNKSRQSRVYHRNIVLYITNAKALYIIIAKKMQPMVDDMHLMVMICTINRDDMPLLSQWIKKSTSQSLSIF
ncbi:MAG: hypothetical protein IJ400_04680, partial [Clostridia bacterium]|nr:hypothetical protein [Clostridia bacterium]